MTFFYCIIIHINFLRSLWIVFVWIRAGFNTRWFGVGVRLILSLLSSNPSLSPTSSSPKFVSLVFARNQYFRFTHTNLEIPFAMCSIPSLNFCLMLFLCYASEESTAWWQMICWWINDFSRVSFRWFNSQFSVKDAESEMMDWGWTTIGSWEQSMFDFCFILCSICHLCLKKLSFETLTHKRGAPLISIL